jgi:hypothetical protein
MRLQPARRGYRRVRTLSAAVRVFVLQTLISRSSSGARHARMRSPRSPSLPTGIPGNPIVGTLRRGQRHAGRRRLVHASSASSVLSRSWRGRHGLPTTIWPALSLSPWPAVGSAAHQSRQRWRHPAMLRPPASRALRGHILARLADFAENGQALDAWNHRKAPNRTYAIGPCASCHSRALGATAFGH